MISIIIPTYNEKKSLEECIESLRKQSVSDFEIVVIDDGSTDDTLEILKKFKKTISNFKFAKQNHKGAGAARNFGEKFAKGKILVFVDADMTFDRDFLKNLVAPIEHPPSPGFGGQAASTLLKENSLVLQFARDAHAVVVVHGAGFGQAEPARGAVEQADAETVFEFADMTRDRRL